ncbi:unnamed protein product [Phaedon cochleariae]|uniref:protein-tyrosine-phosphatase n=1 Tax=Phaedon cochleariae TaxID=80249 RepID=A0A9P0DPJ2_PHACE|nr:unnamed protein product [Phaedon cochleariae]
MNKQNTNDIKEIDSYIEILENQLFFAVLKGKASVKLRNTFNTFFFSIDDELIYENYFSDFGPLNMSCVYKYCLKLRKYLQYAKGIKSVVHYTCDHPNKKANAACLMGLFSVIYLNIQPRDIWKVLQELGPYKPFVDASQCPIGFTLKIVDCLQAMYKALTFNFIDFDDFNINEYDLYDKLQYGDLNWLVPRKFLAFLGPADNKSAHPPEFYLKYFLKNDVKTVIRLNSIIYDSSVFNQVGIQHFDLIFPDGTTPPKDILLKFLTIAEMAPAAIAVHCKAGLGRTGSLIGAYLVKHYRLTAKEAIAWMRLCRPGSVIGQQQIWLEKIETWLWRIGSQYRVRKYGAGDKIPKHKYGIYSKQWPIEREKIILEARKRIQSTFTKSQLDKLARQKKISASVDAISRDIKQQRISKNPSAAISYKSVSKLINSAHGSVKSQAPINMSTILPPPMRMNLESQLMSSKPEFVTHEAVKSLDSTGSPHSNIKASSNKILRKFTPEKRNKNLTTQGDKLNEIKASWRHNKVLNNNLESTLLEDVRCNKNYRLST